MKKRCNRWWNVLFPEYASQFSFEQSEKIDKDWYEIEAQGGTVRIRGNNANSMAVGLNYYLNHYCLTSVSWYVNDTVEMPEVLPMPPAKIISTAVARTDSFLITVPSVIQCHGGHGRIGNG